MFEKSAKRFINFGWEHGRVFDYWSILHLLSGAILGFVASNVGAMFWPSFVIVLVSLLLYEGAEMVVHIIEDIENVVADIAIGLVGFTIAFQASGSLSHQTELYAIVVSSIAALVLLQIGWQKHLEHKIRKENRKARVSELKSRLFVIAMMFVGLIPSIAVFVYDAKLAIIWLASVFLGIAFFVYRRGIGEEFLIALLFALFVTSYNTYVYDSVNVFIGKVNLFPLVSWTAGLVLLREVYERFPKQHRFVLMCGLYILVLFTLEYIGYYLAGIRIENPFPSLFGLGIIHGPPMMQWFYLLAGPVYLLVTDYLRVK